MKLFDTGTENEICSLYLGQAVVLHHSAAAVQRVSGFARTLLIFLLSIVWIKIVHSVGFSLYVYEL